MRIVKAEENNLGWYIKSSREILLRKVGEISIVTTEEAVEPNEYKKSKSQEMEDAWKQKVMHGQFVRDKEGVNERNHGNGLQKEI